MVKGVGGSMTVVRKQSRLPYQCDKLKGQATLVIEGYYEPGDADPQRLTVFQEVLVDCLHKEKCGIRHWSDVTGSWHFEWDECPAKCSGKWEWQDESP
jgi:hypothetical protein